MKNLEEVEVGDKVWSINYGYGKVIEIEGIASEFPISVEFDSVSNWAKSHTSDGKEYRGCKEPSLFFEMPEFYKNKQYPKKPRWRANKDETYYYVTSDGCTNDSYDTRSDTDNRRFKVWNYFKSSEDAQESKIFKAYKREED